MNLPLLHIKAFDWMCSYRDAHPDTFFVFRKSPRGEHTLGNGFCFTGSDIWACVGITTENNRSTHNTISIGFTAKKTYIHVGYDNNNPYGAKYDFIVNKSGFHFTSNKDNTKTCYTYEVTAQNLNKDLETIINIAVAVLPSDVLENESHYKQEFEKVIKIMKPYKSYVDVLSANKNLILTGAPGTGKTYLAKEIAKTMTGDNDDNHPHFEMVQFHPSYDYGDFVEGLRPVKDATGNIGFERKDGVFKAFCKKALNDFNNAEKKNEAPKYVFIIDEINRGEMSKIFGELFFSIDPGYRGTKGRIKTQYQNLIDKEYDEKGNIIGDDIFKDGFFVPENVYIIGTMNDIDRSVESMDFAMRRRFAFKEIKATDRIDMWNDNNQLSAEKIKLANSLMRSLNHAIVQIPGLSSAYHVGPSYFLKLKECNEDELWTNSLDGLLFEYLRGMPDADSWLSKLKGVYLDAKNKQFDGELASNIADEIIRKMKS